MEGESLGVLFGILSNRMYLYGTEFEVVVDHRPLVSLYNSPNRPAPVRVDRHRSKLLAFRFKVVYSPGHQNPSDYASRNPRKDNQGEATAKELGIEGEEEDAEFAVNRVLEEDLPGAITMEVMRRETEEDQVLQCVMGDIEKGHMGKLTAAS